MSHTEFSMSKIGKIDNLKMISNFIDLTNYYHLQKCSISNCLSCHFTDRLTQIYILFYPNINREEEDGTALVSEFQKYFLKYYGCFYSLYTFLESIYLLNKQEDNLKNERKMFFFVLNLIILHVNLLNC